MLALDELARGVAAAAMSLALSASALAADVTGAGATFPYAVYTEWAEAYRAATGDKVNYQGIGSSGGVKQIKAIKGMAPDLLDQTHRNAWPITSATYSSPTKRVPMRPGRKAWSTSFPGR
ncbi:hypothetical protein [Thiobacillus sp.]